MQPAQLTKLKKELRSFIYGQDEMIEATIAAIIAGGNVLLISPPSCGKTRIAKALLSAIRGENTFYIQAGIGTRPEHLIGDIDIKELRETGKIVHKPDRLLVASIGAIDEFLLIPPEAQKILNEVLQDRTHENKPTSVKSVICMTNPGEIDPSVHDRFTCIVETKGIIERQDRDQTCDLIKAIDSPIKFKHTIDDYSNTVDTVSQIRVPSYIYIVLADIINSIILKSTIPMYDRTAQHCLALLRYGAWCNDHTEVDFEDFNYLHYGFFKKTSLDSKDIVSIIQISKELGLIRRSYARRNKKEAKNHIEMTASLTSSYDMNHPLRVALEDLRAKVNSLTENDPTHKKITGLMRSLQTKTGKADREKVIKQIQDIARIVVPGSVTHSDFITQIAATGAEKIEENGMRWSFDHDPGTNSFVITPLISNTVKSADQIMNARETLKVRIGIEVD